jgi:hypothetical protein
VPRGRGVGGYGTAAVELHVVEGAEALVGAQADVEAEVRARVLGAHLCEDLALGIQHRLYRYITTKSHHDPSDFR